MASVLERGELFFFYQPYADVRRAHGLDDVERFYAVMHPRDRRVYRRLMIGQKRLPRPEEHEREWVLVERVEFDPRVAIDDLSHGVEAGAPGGPGQPGARPVGEAVYAIVGHEEHRHLAYRLELPRELGEVQDAFGLQLQASFIVTVLNPFAPTRRDRQVTLRYPDRLQHQFKGRDSAALDPAFLDYEDTEIVLIGATADLHKAVGDSLDPQHESFAEAAIFKDLALDVREHPIEPLERGAWA